MKKLMLALVLTGCCWSCKNEEKKVEKFKETSTISESFDWLLGDWERTNEQVGKETFETWKKAGDNEYQGFGFTMQNLDTIWQEKIILINRHTGWNFEVTGKGESEPTIFKIINIQGERFDSENQENEFPKIISYYKEGDKLKAVISGGDIEIAFEFESVKTQE